MSVRPQYVPPSVHTPRTSPDSSHLIPPFLVLSSPYRPRRMVPDRGQVLVRSTWAAAKVAGGGGSEGGAQQTVCERPTPTLSPSCARVQRPSFFAPSARMSNVVAPTHAQTHGHSHPPTCTPAHLQKLTHARTSQLWGGKHLPSSLRPPDARFQSRPRALLHSLRDQFVPVRAVLKASSQEQQA